LNWFSIVVYIAVYHERFELILNQKPHYTFTGSSLSQEIWTNSQHAAAHALGFILRLLHLAIVPLVTDRKKWDIDSLCCVRIGNELILNKGGPVCHSDFSADVFSQRPAP
jgi:hypothetical protein